MSDQVQESVPQKRITISEVLSLLEQGKSRKEIAIHFGHTQTAMQKMVWSHPKLKAKKAKKQYSEEILLEDDTEEIQSVVESTDDAGEQTVTETVDQEEVQ